MYNLANIFTFLHSKQIVLCSLLSPHVFQMVAEASTQPLVEQKEEQVSVQEVQELKDTLSQAEVKTKSLEAQVESLQKVRTVNSFKSAILYSIFSSSEECEGFFCVWEGMYLSRCVKGHICASSSLGKRGLKAGLNPVCTVSHCC